MSVSHACFCGRPLSRRDRVSTRSSRIEREFCNSPARFDVHLRSQRRDREAGEATLKEMEDLEKVRNMTMEERKE
ncbi:hypothetical protein ACOSQ3_014548 [Xanthoceras sorbifolium]